MIPIQRFYRIYLPIPADFQLKSLSAVISPRSDSDEMWQKHGFAPMVFLEQSIVEFY
jgi:hypothetical protein